MEARVGMLAPSMGLGLRPTLRVSKNALASLSNRPVLEVLEKFGR